MATSVSLRSSKTLQIVVVALAAGAIGCAEDKLRGITGPAKAHDAGITVDAGALPDAGEPDSGPPDAGPPPVDAGTYDAGVLNCPYPTETYNCDPADASTCPGGICIVSWCVGQVVDAGEYDQCGDGICEPCETPETCPADCAPPPTFTGTKSYDDPKTISIWVHGFASHSTSSSDTTTYGAIVGCNDLGAALATYEPQLPCASDGDNAPNQIAAVEYYGSVPASWLSQSDIMEIEQYPYLEGPTGLQRYGLIVAKFIKWRLSATGADYVNLACHSMGCEISRYIIENDIEGLASSNRIVRWETNCGVIAGAQFSRLYDNPNVQMYAQALGLGTVSDFALMNPLYAEEYAAAYDHQLYEGNSPLYGGILIHMATGTDPDLPEALGFSLIDDVPDENPGDNPNDGIMFTFDEFFHSQQSQGSTVTPSGTVMQASHSYFYVSHIDEPKYEGAHMLMAAGLFHRRKVIVTLQSISLTNDFETDSPTPLMVGPPPAEIVAQTTVDYNSYTLPTYGTSATIDTDQIAYRSPEMFQQTMGTTLMPNQVLFDAPVFDNQTDFDLNVVLTETDYYPRVGTMENSVGAVLSTDQTIASYNGMNEPLTNHVIPVTGAGGTAQLQVQVIEMY
jgi:hypothetical protein